MCSLLPASGWRWYTPSTTSPRFPLVGSGLPHIVMLYCYVILLCLCCVLLLCYIVILSNSQRVRVRVKVRVRVTSLRPDIVLWSKVNKQVVVIELTVPWEDRMEEAHVHKLKKYQALNFESQQNGCKAWNLPVEIGCRGFAGQLLWRELKLLGIEEPARKQLVANVTKQAEAASRWIWIKRNERWQSQPGDGLTIS